MATRTERVEARLSPEERQRIRRAADLAGQSLSKFMVGAAVEKAERVIASQATTGLPPDYFDRLVSALDEAEPAPRLARAAKALLRRGRIR